MIPIDLSGRVALVTGAGGGGPGGIGREVALTLARAGARVAANDLVEDLIRETVRQIREAGAEGLALVGDVTDRPAVGRWVEDTTAKLGPVDILVNVAATWDIAPFIDSEPTMWERDVRVSLFGAMNCAQAVLPTMRDRGGGRIISFASDAARVGEPNVAGYSAAKAGVIGFSKALAKEVGRYGITVNVVSPGTTRAGTAEQPADEERHARQLRLYPLRRLGTPQDLAGAVLSFASDLAGHITGQVLSVSGGYTMVG
jgi:NAD(P)-dependent dehydrogenase (short-subunit alcohol dehydrogenase family)